METPVLVPSEEWNSASKQFRDRLLDSCTSLTNSALNGKPCKWHIRSQNNAQYPYLLTAFNPQNNEPMRQFDLDDQGQSTTIGVNAQTVSSPDTIDQPQPSSESVSQSISQRLSSFGLRLLSLDISQDKASSGTGNLYRLDVLLDEVKGDRGRIEHEVREAYCAVARQTQAVQIQVQLLQEKPIKPKLSSIDLPSPSRSMSSSPYLGTNVRAPTGLQKKSSLSSLKGSGGATPPRSPVSRRASSNLISARNLSSPKASAPPLPEAPAPKTPASVAKEYFQRELMNQRDSRADSELIVILHDSCYGHRFSRPKTSKGSLSTIVERPERILATVLGISAAYVLIGGRYTGADFAPHPEREPGPLPFKIHKSNRFVPLVSPTVTNVHGTAWMNELKIMCERAEAKLTSTGKELVRPVLRNDDAKDKPPLHEGDLYLCDDSLNALEGALGGVLDAVDAVFDVSGPRRAFVAIRPPGHHCSADYPSGFCWLNNVHVGISHAAAVHGLTHAAIIDFDLHHGDGSQSITWNHNARVASLPRNAAYSKRAAIGYFSLHDINSYPCEWGDQEKVQNASLCIEQAHGQTIWNVHLQPWKTNDEFWELYEKRYTVLLDKMRVFLKHHSEKLYSLSSAPQPRAAIFISAGFDASEWEGQGMQRHKVNVPTDFYARFTRDIMELANETGLGTDGRIISVLEGGYSDRALTSGVLSHISGMADVVVPTPDEEGLAQDVTDRLGAMSLNQKGLKIGRPRGRGLGPEAWSPMALEELESAVNPLPPTAPKKPRGPINPTYSTPTQSFSAKMHPAARRSSSSAQDPLRFLPIQEMVPDVGWATATLELSKALTPDRQTRSCKAEELNAQATKVRRDRQSGVGIAVEHLSLADDGKGMQLRDRRSKAPAVEEGRPPSRSSRRTTIAASEIANLVNAEAEQPPKGPRRRVSAASTLISTIDDSTGPPPLPTERRRRSSAASVARSSSAASKRREPSVEKTRKPRSPSKAKVAQKKSLPTSTVMLSSPIHELPPAAMGSRREHGVDDITSGVQKMKIKLNLPSKPSRDGHAKPVPAQEVPAKPKPRKTPVGPKAPRKAVPAMNMQASTTSIASSKTRSELVRRNSGAETGQSFDPTNVRPSSSGINRPDPAGSTAPTGEIRNPGLARGTPDSSATSRTSLKSGQRSGVQSPDGQDAAFEVQPFDAAKASGEASRQGATAAMGTMSSFGQVSASRGPLTAVQTETPRQARRQLPTFTSTSPIPFASPGSASADKATPTFSEAVGGLDPETGGVDDGQGKERAMWVTSSTPQPRS